MHTEAAKFSSKRWTEAEKKFNKAAIKLEDGDLNEAKKKAGEAETLYRQAELEAIKTNYLQGTRELLKQADKLKVKDHAPRSPRSCLHPGIPRRSHRSQWNRRSCFADNGHSAQGR
ncbi:hypothetical protein JW992_08455 [candidate division KSB1 bacterium]|nr:hypothetical protein [candidate division KSB1 bacterium]